MIPRDAPLITLEHNSSLFVCNHNLCTHIIHFIEFIINYAHIIHLIEFIIIFPNSMFTVPLMNVPYYVIYYPAYLAVIMIFFSFSLRQMSVILFAVKKMDILHGKSDFHHLVEDEFLLQLMKTQQRSLAKSPMMTYYRPTIQDIRMIIIIRRRTCPAMYECMYSLMKSLFPSYYLPCP